MRSCCNGKQAYRKNAGAKPLLRSHRKAMSSPCYNASLQSPDLDCVIPSSRAQVAIHEAQPLDGARVPVDGQRRMLQRRAVEDLHRAERGLKDQRSSPKHEKCSSTHPNAILSRRRHNLATIELQPRDGVLVADGV